ncbi:F-actin-monooxygenase MICAL3 isoform X1 [Eumetopias jubatus]|uniref:F-actin-monooxygenase MICAL3 isoform X1 n=1 Tax=Eumetopias jubatus TaxID=34886 RepID=UPI001015DC37|nr:F-actin-monooxygenase MICAL3 isoform X1 [Eumetopias jubatus]
MEDSKNETMNRAHVLFDRFVQATTCKGTLKAFQELCDHLELKPKDYRSFYHKLKSKLNYWKAKALWAKLDKRGSHKDYKKGKACTNTKCLIIGAGPCGLRTAIDLSLLGAKVVVIEKRDAFSRNNVLHLWPFTIHDLRGLGAKKFYGKFCAGAIDHISIRQLQLILLKVALILGIEIHVNVEFQGLVQPPEDQENERIGWRALVHPKTHPVSEYEFEVIIGGDGRRNTLEGFRRKEFRGKLAIAITANFINRNTTAEAKVEEISGVAFIFNQKFFQELREATGIDLENIVYYKDDTHYFVMTAKKQSLLDKGVILHDYADTELLLSRENVDREALLNYAREAADFSTQQQLPSLDFAINHYGQPDVAMFDFTCMYASENAALVREQNGHQLLVALVGDSLLEPFWPMGTGIARGFLAAMDSAWMVRSWSLGTSPLEVLAERESIYRLLPQTTPENVSKNFSQYSIDPVTRYPNININFLRPSQVRHLYDTGETKDIRLEMENLVNSRTTPKLTRNESVARSSKLLGWCQRQTDGYAGVNVTDLTMSWKSGLALCAIIHRYRPDLIDFDSLDEQNVEKNNQLAFDIAEKELGISPIMTGKEMASVGEPDKLSMVMYLTQFYEMFKDSLPSSEALDLNAEEKAVLIASTKSPISFLSKLGQTISRKRSPKDKKEKDPDGTGKRRKTSQSEEEDVPRGYRGGRPTLVSTLTDRRMDVALGNQNKVKYMATQLLAKFEENAPPQSTGMRRQPTQERGVSQPSCCLPEQGHPAPTPQWKQGSIKKEFPQNLGGSDTCYFCRKRVYVMERLSAEGKFFHRSCFKCEYCATTLRLSAYAYDIEDGKFYCKPHYCYRLSGSAQRKRPAVAPLSGKEAREALQDGPTVDANGRASAMASPAERTPGSSVNGLEEPSIAKRLRGTPERIELENYRLSVKQAEELEEVPEETQAEHNLSSVLDKGAEEDVASSSSESEMEEEEEEEPPLPTSDLGGVPWKEAVRIHALLKGKSEEELEASKSYGPGNEEEEEEEYEEEEEEEEEEEYEEEEEESSEDQHWSDDIPSEAETELRVRQQAVVEAELELRASESEEEQPVTTPGHQERSPAQVPSPAPSPEEQAGLLSPGHSPVAEPVPAKTSIPMVPLPLKNQRDAKDRLGSPLAVDEALKRNDLVAEFWMKSAEIRRSLGLTPVDRSKVSESSFPSPAFKPVSLKSYSVEKSQGEGLQLLKPPPVPKRLGLPKSDGDQPSLPTPKSPSDRELKSSHEERRDLSSSSGLGLHGSSSNMKTLGSQSFNTSDSTMLTPPSSPPPPPPQDEEPATLRRKPYQTYEHKETKPKASVIPPPPPASFMRAPREPAQPPREEVRKSFVESVDEIPFADDVEDTYDDKTEDSSLQEKFFTPPSYWPRIERPLHSPLAKENGRLPTLDSGVQPQKRGLPVVSPEAKELAEERMRAREKSVKSQALRDAMAKQLSRMKEMEMAAGTSRPPGGTSRKASSVPSKGKDLGPESPKRLVLKGPREPTLKHEATSEEVLSPPSDSGGPDGSVTSSEGSSGKSKKRSSLFSPRRNKKEKKSKGEGRPPEKPSPNLEEAAAKPKSLWKSVFSGYKKDKKKKGDDKSCSSTPSSGATVDSGKHRMSPIVRAELQLRRQLSFSEDSDLSSDDILERSSQKSRREPRTYTEEELNAKLTRRVQKAARRQAKQEELKRLHRAQIIQRQLEQVEEKQRQLEERGVAVEKALRGEAGMGKKDDPKLMQEWFKLVQEKNAMVRYESELMIFARELELEDRQSRLQQELRERMAVEDHLKTEEELSEEKKILNEMLEVVEQRDALVALLEEQRLREKEEDKDLEAVMLSKGFSLNWS